MSATLFISHGAPSIALDSADPARQFLKDLSTVLPRPRALCVISAHWETGAVSVLATPKPETIHDFYGFAPELYRLEYPALGSVETGDRVRNYLADAGFEVHRETQRGLDHGAWIPLSLMYPEASVPVVQVAVNPAESAAHHWRLGTALAPLREQDILIIGSGAMTHNLQDFRSANHGVSATSVPDYARDFSAWMAAQVDAGDLEALLDYRRRGPGAARAHPRAEHLLPFYVALGAACPGWLGERIYSGFQGGVIAMDAYRFDAVQQR